MRVQTVTGGLLGVNTYIVCADEEAGECVVIDPGVPQAQLTAALDGRRVCAVLLTHAHFDHMLSAPRLLQDGARLYVGAADVPALTDERLNLCGMIREHVRLECTPVCLQDGDTVQEAGLTFRVMTAPGHTVGGVCYYADRTLFSGDTLFLNGYGRTDFPGGDARMLRASLHRLCTTLEGETRVLCGHGGETSIAAERSMGY